MQALYKLPGIRLLCILAFISTLCILGNKIQQVRAQGDVFANIAYPIYINLPQSEIREGSVITLKETGYALASVENDEDIIGVVSETPSVYYQGDTEGKNSYLVGGGVAHILVDTSNGPIKKGDYLTSSTKQGVGVKAITTGKVVGKALEDHTASSTSLILANIKPERHDIYQEENNISGIGIRKAVGATTLRLLNIANLFALKEPSKAFRYILAILVTLLTIISSFLVFGRMVLKGIEGISRNPLAGRLIIFGIAINAVLTFMVCGLGIFLAYLIVAY